MPRGLSMQQTGLDQDVELNVPIHISDQESLSNLSHVFSKDFRKVTQSTLEKSTADLKKYSVEYQDMIRNI